MQPGTSPVEVTVTEASSNEPIYETIGSSDSMLHKSFIWPSLQKATAYIASSLGPTSLAVPMVEVTPLASNFTVSKVINPSD